MAQNLNVAINIVGKDQASGPIGRVTRALGGLRKRSASVVRGLGSLVRGLGALGLASMGLQAIAGTARAAGRALGVHLNTELENTRAQIQAFTKDAEVTERVLAAVREEANSTPFSFRELATATGGLIPAAKQAREPLMELIDTAEILAASNPAEGLEGAAFSLREAVSGDFQSIIERFNLPRTAINRLKAEGVPALEVVRRAMGELGFDAELVANQSRTLTGRWSTFVDTIDGIRRKLSKPIFEQLKRGLEGVQSWFRRNSDTVDLWATIIGERLGGGVSTVMDWIGRLGMTIEENKSAITSFGTNVIATVETVLAGTGMLVRGMTRGLGALLDVVMDVGSLIYEALQLLNPSARHSPSLVEQVDEGVDQIHDKFMRLTDITRPLREVSEAVKEMGSNTTAAGAGRLKGVVEGLKERADSLKDSLSSAQSRLRDLTSTPIQGEGALADKIFGTEQEIAKRRLRLLELQEMRGPGVRAEARRIAGEIEDLERQSQKLNLQEQIEFDPLRRQIEQAANPQQEKPFEAIISGVRDARSDIETLQPAVEAATAAWEAQASALESVAGAMDETSGGGGALDLGLEGAEGTIDGLKTTMEEWNTQLSEARTNMDEKLSPAFNGMAGNIEKVNGFLDTLNTQLDTIQEQGLEEWVREQLAGVDWGQLAKDVGTQGFPVAMGLVKGWYAGLFRALIPDRVESFFQTYMIDPVKELLGIQSASTLFAGFGGDVVQGMIDGLGDKARALWDAAKGIGGDLWDGITAGFTQAKDAAKGIAGGIPLPEINLPNPFRDIPGFARGGSFMVGGAGGTDSQMVMFRASPNERVTVETPQQQSGVRDVHVSVTVAQGAVQVTGDVDRRFGERLGEAIADLARGMVLSEEFSLIPARATLPGAR